MLSSNTNTHKGSWVKMSARGEQHLLTVSQAEQQQSSSEADLKTP